MANSDNARGLVPAKTLSGGAYTGQIRRYYIPASDATAAYVGGLAKLAGGADTRGIATVTGNVSAADVVVGVIVGFDQYSGVSNPNLNIRYRPASTAMYVYVETDPNTLFEIQEDGDTTPIAAASVGLNATLLNLTAGNTSTGQSTMEIDSDSVAVTATLDVQIVEMVQREDNEIGAFAKWLVKLNNHQYVDGTTGIS